MYILELSQQILREMRARKMRSFLAIFGIAWGTLTVVMLLALGEGYLRASQTSIAGISQNKLIFWPLQTSTAYRGMPPERVLQVKADAIMTMAQQIPAILFISPNLENFATVNWRNQIQKHACVMGVNTDYARLNGLLIKPEGRFINSIDIFQKRYVVFLGYELTKKLFAQHSAMGEKILINGIPFLVVGTQQSKKNTVSFNAWDQYCAILPYSTALAVWGNKNIRDFSLIAAPSESISQLKKTVYRYLAHQYQFDPNDKNALFTFSPDKFLRFFHWFFRGVKFFLGLCGVLTLGVGGISVANIMFLIVRERTAEIGLRMAVGARTSDIMLQVMLEAGLIVALGGIIGLALSLMCMLILHFITLPAWLGTPIFSWFIMFITLLVLMLVALLAGFFPARKAANLQPVVALNSV